MKRTLAERSEDMALVLILLVVGLFSGAASFTHVHDWTMAHTPPGRGEWFGWANAVISELVPIAALLVMRRRRRAGQSIVYPAVLLVAGLALSITAQLAVAKPGLSGWVVSVVPALAFAALAKLVLGKASALREPVAPPVYHREPTNKPTTVGVASASNGPIGRLSR
ncbi:hypothetical protein Rhe02_61640 [Rhizocola hellebori]|uniref:DUF2637 domain-containing protein n=1 Tax=Rhizocola hellebori TaxID=1392758 RepID=A0A8J3VJ56_9ACTN|nr:hypothetical protein Rhe02_61640 [Rhizocola hellebori]